MFCAFFAVDGRFNSCPDRERKQMKITIKAIVADFSVFDKFDTSSRGRGMFEEGHEVQETRKNIILFLRKPALRLDAMVKR